MTEDKQIVQFRFLEELEREYNAPVDRRRALVACEGVLTDLGVELATMMARRYLLPISSIALISSKNGYRPYVTADGELFRIHHDSRGSAAIHTDIVQWAAEDNKGVARAKCTLKFTDGSEFTAYAQLTLDEEKRKNPRADYDTVTMKCETKSVRRCCHRATGIPFPIYEEAKEYVREEGQGVVQVVEGEIVQDKMGVPQFLSKLKDMHCTLPEALGILGKKTIGDIGDYDSAIADILKVGKVEQPTTGGQEGKPEAVGSPPPTPAG